MSVRILKLVLFFLFAPAMVMAAPRTIDTKVRWEGEVVLTDAVQVAPKGVLRIASGTRVKISDPAIGISVQGQLFVEGTDAHPVVFDTAQGWSGISFVEAASGSIIRQARFANCAQALGIIATSPQIIGNQFQRCDSAVKLLRESSAEIRGNRFVDNVLGLGVEMRSSPTVIDNEFIGNKKSGITASNSSRGRIEGNLFEKNEQGVGLLQQYPDVIGKNLFVENRVGLYCYQTQNTPRVVDNRFEKNEYGLVNFSFSFPMVKNNKFLSNKTAIQNDQFGSADIFNNLFEKNETAVYNNRKSNPKIHQNEFVGNHLALFVDYSSYPKVKQNNFLKTAEGARLGIYQSADWEKRSGSKQLVMKNAKARGSKNAMLGQAPTEFIDIVDLSGNWWGEMNAALSSSEPEVNQSFFYDRKDKESVVYKGFGPESYRLDLIKFRPVLKQAVSGTGPQ